MESTCPACLSQVSHEDSETKVNCSCGFEFEPGANIDGELPPMDALITSQPKKTAPKSAEPPSEIDMDEIPDLNAPMNFKPPSEEAVEESEVGSLEEPLMMNEQTPEVEELSSGMQESQVAPPPAESFDESNAAFEEIRDFGEDLLDPDAESAKKAQSPPTQKAEEPSPPEPVSESKIIPKASTEKATPDGTVMVFGEQIPGYKVDSYLSPISIWSELNTESEDPMSAAFESLWVRCQGAGGNAVVSIRWSVSPDGSHILVAGTPVQCVKEKA